MSISYRYRDILAILYRISKTNIVASLNPIDGSIDPSSNQPIRHLSISQLGFGRQKPASATQDVETSLNRPTGTRKCSFHRPLLTAGLLKPSKVQ